jgi:hypothetical protein
VILSIHGKGTNVAVHGEDGLQSVAQLACSLPNPKREAACPAEEIHDP